MKYMLDTNMCIFLMKGNANALRHCMKYKDSGLTLSSITVAELYYGVFNSTNIEKNNTNLTNFLIGFTILDFDSGAAVEYGILRADLQKKGKTIGQLDMLIGAHAKSRNLTLVTNNTNEFERIDSLQLEDWL